MKTDETMDLWPDHFEPESDGELPVVILRQQAALLGRKTRGLVEAEVKTTAAPAGTRMSFSPVRLVGEPELEPARFAHRFLLRVPAVEDYRYALFTVYQQPTDLYPLRIDFDDRTWEVKDREDLDAALRLIFADESTKRVIGTLMAQSDKASVG